MTRYRAKHQPCACGCGDLADECMKGVWPLQAFTAADYRKPLYGNSVYSSPTQEPCFYCRRGMHDSCISGEVACRCCADGGQS